MSESPLPHTDRPAVPARAGDGSLVADLVLEGGGVRGIALVGAVQVLEEHGYRFNRVAGTSAGSIVGALVAAGIPSTTLAEWMTELDYRRFCDGSWYEHFLTGKAASLMLNAGVFKGDYAHAWIAERLGAAAPAVQTFADLPYGSDGDGLPLDRRYRLVVNVSDLTQGCLRRFPYDYREHYALDPGAQKVADAVRASMSIPFFFRPTWLTATDGTKSWLVDGGLLSNFPIDVFDAPVGVAPRWPTLGVKLSADASAAQGQVNDIHGPVGMVKALATTVTGFYDRMHIDDLHAQARTIFVDTGSVRSTDFGIGAADRSFLYERGRAAAEKFLKTWDFDAYVAHFR